VGQSPVQIQFQSSVQGASDVYTWTFSNGATASGASTTYSYPSNGTYSVNLAVSDSSTGCAANASLTFVIEGTCGSFAPNFTYSIGIGGIVTFTDNSYDWDTAGSNGLSYLWNFGDGNTVNNSGYQVNHTYSANGTYTVSLEMLNASQGCDSVVSQTFELNRCAPAAQFNDWQNGFGSYVFVNTDYLTIADTLFNYAWTFGDGGTAFSNSPGHLYTASGNYIVTLIATSSILGCADTSKQTLAVTLCSFNDAIDTSVLSYGPEDIQFAPASNVAGYTYAWSFSDGGTATGTPVTHTYSASGSYTVNLSVSDASLGCSTTSSLTLQINNTCGLTAGFANGGNGLTQFFYTYIYDSLSATIASCSWSFPGATPSTATGLNVSGIVYPAVGTYSACAYIVSTGGCVDTVCQSVVVSAATYTISGTAGKTGGPGFAGVVYLIVQDSTGHLALLDSTVSNFDSAGVFNYYFGGLPVDTYYVKAALSTLDADYANYLPTYYGDVLNWGTATPVIISNNDASSIDISLIAGSNPGGPGFVGGYVSEGAGLVIGNTGNANAKALGDPIAGVQINLLTSTNQAVAYTFTDVNGHYQFADLALGSYKIYVEQLNKVPTPLDFTLTAENPVDSGADMNVNSHGTTGIDNTSNLQIMEVYPNPVVSSVQVQIGCKQAADATLKVVDILGRTDLEQGTKLTSGQNTAEVDMTAFAAGVYQLVIQTGSQQVTYKIVKAR
jgi:PKD repeat protein